MMFTWLLLSYSIDTVSGSNFAITLLFDLASIIIIGFVIAVCVRGWPTRG